MIHKTLQFTSDILNQYLKNKFELEEDKVVLNNIVQYGGSVQVMNENKVVISLINIEKETARPFYSGPGEGGNYSDAAPNEMHNLDILITVNFNDYSEGLKFLDAAMAFFQLNPFFDTANATNIPRDIIKIEFGLLKTDYQQMQNLWKAMAASYRPSVIYKIRQVAATQTN
jgi:hypothetical protein